MNTDSILIAVLDAMQASARAGNHLGVAGAAYLTGAGELISRTRDCGKVFDAWGNYIGIVHAKLAEMCETREDSGTGKRAPLVGELGYAGGAIRPWGDGYLLAAFSGASSEDDLAISRVGLAAAGDGG